MRLQEFLYFILVCLEHCTLSTLPVLYSISNMDVDKQTIAKRTTNLQVKALSIHLNGIRNYTSFSSRHFLSFLLLLLLSLLLLFIGSSLVQICCNAEGDYSKIKSHCAWSRNFYRKRIYNDYEFQDKRIWDLLVESNCNYKRSKNERNARNE